MKMNFLTIRTSQRLKSIINSVRIRSNFSSSSSPTGLVAYNSQSKKKIPLACHKDGIITWYVCGPTVYDSAHIGHAW